MEQTKNEKLKKALSIVGNVLIYVFCAISLCMLLVTIFSKQDVDGAVNVLGYEMRVVVSGSMEKNDDTYNDIKQYGIKSIKTGSMVFIELRPEDDAKAEEWYSKLEVGDVLTFRYVFAIKQETVTHRIVDKTAKEGGGYIIRLKGDNDNDIQTIDTTQIATSPNYVLGKVIGKSYVFGKFVTVLKTPIGMSLIIIVPCAIIIIWQVITIVNVVNAGKRKKAEEMAQQRLDEMEELKRRLAELEGGKSGSAQPSDVSSPPTDASDGSAADNKSE